MGRDSFIQFLLKFCLYYEDFKWTELNRTRVIHDICIISLSWVGLISMKLTNLTPIVLKIWDDRLASNSPNLIL